MKHALSIAGGNESHRGGAWQMIIDTDLVVVGGGLSGVAVAADAASRGVKVILV